MAAVGVVEARDHLEELLDRAAAGEDVVIARPGKARVHLVADPAPAADDRVPPRKRVLGLGKGLFEWSDSFFDPMTDEELKDWGL